MCLACLVFCCFVQTKLWFVLLSVTGWKYRIRRMLKFWNWKANFLLYTCLTEPLRIPSCFSTFSTFNNRQESPRVGRSAPCRLGTSTWEDVASRLRQPGPCVTMLHTGEAQHGERTINKTRPRLPEPRAVAVNALIEGKEESPIPHSCWGPLQPVSLRHML